ncbi:MAG: hypothetical protein ACC628_15775, partial [Pirellulaceae bacterium]
ALREEVKKDRKSCKHEATPRTFSSPRSCRLCRLMGGGASGAAGYEAEPRNQCVWRHLRGVYNRSLLTSAEQRGRRRWTPAQRNLPPGHAT